MELSDNKRKEVILIKDEDEQESRTSKKSKQIEEYERKILYRFHYFNNFRCNRGLSMSHIVHVNDRSCYNCNRTNIRG